MNKVFTLFGHKGTTSIKNHIAEARSLATSNDCKYVEVSAALDHNVDTLLVGIIKQIRLKVQSEARKNKVYAR